MQKTLLQLVKERFADFTEIQKRAIPKVLDGKNALIIAPTGYGKTEAAVLPIFEKIDESAPKNGIVALYISPLRSLNRDMLSRLQWWCKELGIGIGVRNSDVSASEKAKQANNPPQFLITTPETLQAMLASDKLGAALCNVKYVIVDEVHAILDNKRGCQLSLALERLEEKIARAKEKKADAIGEKIAANAHETAKAASVIEHFAATGKKDNGFVRSSAIPSSFQRIGLSATIGNEKEAAEWLCGKRQCEIIKVDAGRKMMISISAPLVGEKKHHEPDDALNARLDRIEELLASDKALIFTNTRQSAELLSARLLARGANVLAHHGSLAREARIEAEEAFKGGKVRALVCTSSLELGIDIGDVSLVIQYLSPKQASRLLQRAGRSNHMFFKTPKAEIICASEEDRAEAEAIVQMAREGWVEDEQMEASALDVIAQQAAGIVLERREISLKELHAIFSRSAAYGIGLEMLWEICTLLGSHRIVYFDQKGEMVRVSERTKHYYFSHLSTIPDERKYRVRNAHTNSVIATLDEEFVAGLGEDEGFILKGMSWSVIGIDDEKGEVIVEPSASADMAVPSWVGEEVPVDGKIAERAAKIRKEKMKGWENAQGAAASAGGVHGFFPDSKTIVIETAGEFASIHAPFGNRINQTVLRLLSHKLTKKLGGKVRGVCDAYRVLLEMPVFVPAGEIAAALSGISDVRGTIYDSLLESSLLRFKFTHASRMFGVLGEGAIASQRQVQAAAGSPVHEEAMRSVCKSYLDLRGCHEVLIKIRRGEITLRAIDAEALSDFALAGSRGIVDFSAAAAAKSEIVAAFIAALEQKIGKFRCDACRKAFFRVIGELEEQPQCPNCKGKVIALIGELLRGKIVRERPERDWETSSALILARGRDAALALSVYGIGAKTAAQILRKPHRGREALFADLLEAQKLFIRNKKYW